MLRSGATVRLHTIKRLLKADMHPMEFGAEQCGDGGQRVAYLIGDYVIKHRVPAWQHDLANNDDNAKPCAARWRYAVPVPALRRVGVEPPEQHRVGNWVVQPYYRPLTPQEEKQWEWLNEAEIAWCGILLDLNARYNLGVHPQHGTVHCFDW